MLQFKQCKRDSQVYKTVLRLHAYGGTTLLSKRDLNSELILSRVGLFFFFFVRRCIELILCNINKIRKCLGHDNLCTYICWTMNIFIKLFLLVYLATNISFFCACQSSGVRARTQLLQMEFVQEQNVSEAGWTYKTLCNLILPA